MADPYFEIDGTSISTSATSIKVDTIAEKTSAHGVTIDGITLKDDLATSGIQATLSSGLSDKTRHINLTPGGAVIPATSGCGTTQVNGTYKSYITADFDKDADEWCFWTFVVPDQYDGGNCVFNVWCKSTATSNDVVFIIYTGDVADAATIDAALGTTITFAAKTVDGTAGDAFVATATADPGWTAGNLATIKLMRDISADSAAADINVILVEIKWEVT